jgi:hypothetical protein
MRRFVKIAVFSFFLLILLFTRLYNLDTTARFTEDESKDLVGIHQIFVDKKLTLVGPTNEQGTKVFSSLTFYMLLPATIIGGFDMVSPAYGTAFWGVLTAILIIGLTKLINPKLVPSVALLTLVWFPLLATSRWAWNPNLVPFWVALGIVSSFLPNRIYRFLAGVSFGLAVHAHYYAIFAVVCFMFLLSFSYLLKKKIADIFLLGLGFTTSLLPFLLFDFRHQPGIFLPNFLSQSKAAGGGIVLSQVVSKSAILAKNLLAYYMQSFSLSLLLIVLTMLLFFYDIWKRSFSLLYLIPWIFQIVAISLIPQFFPHYLIPALVFFIVWVIYKRKGIGQVFSYATILLLILSGILSVRGQLTTPTWAPPPYAVRDITQIIKKEIFQNSPKNINLAVLASPDHNTYGKKYRDLLLVPENIHILSGAEYPITDNLFVISTSSEAMVRQDPAAEMSYFRKGPLIDSWKVADSGWFVYHFTKR